MLTNLAVALTINALLANGILQNQTFWNQFVFYAFYFLMFDAIPMYYPDGQPSNGRIVYDLIRYGKRSEFQQDDPHSDVRKDDDCE
ncbi:hypothetical protein CWR45_13695 [Oceanobacillus chungangensis]|uniref:Uncharacterized protein n=1 Tax=Oceanobacillus chungangensis TaxID=1229152 RepID=A0A3D8PKT8_9BACI|nr:hypothetical protein CWR45_13695 [Oceanobacillus chungangensis]